MEKITLNDITLQKDSPVEYAGEDEFDHDQIAPGRQVSMHFELTLDGGDCIDSNFNGKPVQFTVGDGNLLPGFEKAIFGFRSGDEETVEVSADNAFGQHNPDNVQTFPRTRFPADLAMESGLMINFTDSAGNEQAGVIIEFDASRVQVDFNHPLAGRNILFRVKILAVSS